jgi:WD40 repeat protein
MKSEGDLPQALAPTSIDDIDQPSSSEFQYDAFISYSSRVDYSSARKIESFLESFHRLPVPPGSSIRPLQICRDGSDFKLPVRRGSTPLDQNDPVWNIIQHELSNSCYLIVLCSSGAITSSWMVKEIDWMIANHGVDRILPVVTQARDPVAAPEECFPRQIRDAGLDRSRIWYDVRGLDKSFKAPGVRDYEDELVRLAGDILAWDSEKYGPLAAIWQRDQLKKRRRIATLALVVAAILIGIAVFAIAEAITATRQARRARANATVQTADASFDPLAAALLLLELPPEDEPDGGMRVAERLATSPLPKAVMRGHTDSITRVAFSPDQTHILTASIDGTARMWSTDGHGDPMILGPHEKQVTDAVFNKDGSLIATASQDHSARVWSSTSGQLVKRFDHDDDVKIVRFTSDSRWLITLAQGIGIFWQLDGTQRMQLTLPDDRKIANLWLSDIGTKGEVAATDASIWMFDLDSQGALKVTPLLARPPVTLVQLPDTELNEITFSPDGSRVAITDNKLTLIERLDGTAAPLPLLHDDRVNSVAFNKTGTYVVTACSDGKVRRWDTQTGKVLTIFDPKVHVWVIDLFGKSSETSAENSLSVDHVVVANNGTKITTFSADGVIRLWDANNASHPIELNGHVGADVGVFSSDDSQLVIGASDGTARVWSVIAPTEPLVLEHPKPVYSASFSMDATKILSAASDGIARVWFLDDPGSDIELNAHAGNVTGASFNATASLVVTSHEDGALRVWDVARTKQAKLIREYEKVSPPPKGVQFSRDETKLLTWHKDGVLRIWPAITQGTPTVLKGPVADVWHAEFSRNGKRVLATYEDGTARIWAADDSGAFVLLAGSDGHKKAVLDGAFSPDGGHVVTVSEDGTGRIWRSDGTGHPIILTGSNPGQEWLETCAYNPSGDKVVTTSSAGRVWIWPADGRGSPIVLRNFSDLAHVGSVTSVEFSADGQRVVTCGGMDAALRVWRADGVGRPVNLVGHGGTITEARFSADGTRVVSASEDGSVRVWRTTWADLLTYLRGVTTATLTVEQRMILLGETEQDARVAYERDERAMHRTPLPSDWKFNYR